MFIVHHVRNVGFIPCVLCRCVQYAWSDNFKNPAAWAEVMSKAKDGLISAFDQAVSLREEEIKRSELQRTMPGWNFCTFFLLKVGD